jgi:hypothetical protein
MTPTGNQISVDGIKNLITEYDQRIIIPREGVIMATHNTQHQANLERFQQINDKLSEWKWPLRALIIMVGAILSGVIGLLVRNFLLFK